MVEIRDLTVHTVETDLLTDSVIKEFMQSEIPYFVLLKQGKYDGVYIREYNTIVTDTVKCEWGGVKSLQSIRSYFFDYENRGKLLAIVDDEGYLQTFFAWNQRVEYDESYIESCKMEILNVLQKGYHVVLEDWDEYTAEYIHFLAQQEKFSNQIFLSGKNWELSFYYGKYKTLDKRRKEVLLNKKGIFYDTEEKEVYPLKSMKEPYLHKSIYFYLGLKSLHYDEAYLNAVRYLCTFHNRPDGFCKLGNWKGFQALLGRNVEDLEQITERSDVVIVVLESEMDEVKRYVREKQLVKYEKLFWPDVKQIENDVFQTWGTDALCHKLKQYLCWSDIRMLHKNRKNVDDIPGILSWEFNQEKTPEKYKVYMENVNKHVCLYSMDKLYEAPINMTSFWMLINLQEMLEKKKKVILYGIKSHYTNMWMQIMRMLGISFMIMDDEEAEEWNGYHVECISELAYLEKNNLLVVLNQPYQDFLRAREQLKVYGIFMESHNCISVYEQIDRIDRTDLMIDVCAGPFFGIPGEQGFPGYHLIGDKNGQSFKIMILGGSTSDSANYQYSSWPEELYYILRKQGKKAVIYSGGKAGFYSMQELSKVLRDAREIKPDIIISFSGVNDAGVAESSGRYVNGVNGTIIGYLKNKFEYWLDNEKMMQQEAERQNAKFYCFAQPIFYLNEKFRQYEVSKFFAMDFQNSPDVCSDWRQRVKEVKDYPWFIDVMDILDDNLEVFFDMCHVTTEGNRMIAQHVYEHIKDDIK